MNPSPQFKIDRQIAFAMGRLIRHLTVSGREKDIFFSGVATCKMHMLLYVILTLLL